ncbi:hypothetical protein [Leisingera sp. ANG59]|uniref:hypothetical protein n=1 Tax=Leisingera sp. ANG59 TaxID=2675221 RepID=UPI0034A03143
MHIEPFGVEIWMNEWETKCEWNLAETCVESLTIEELLQLAGKNSADLSELLGMKMTYGAIEGSDRLRSAIAALYQGQGPENVIVTHGTIGANMLVHKSAGRAWRPRGGGGANLSAALLDPGQHWCGCASAAPAEGERVSA